MMVNRSYKCVALLWLIYASLGAEHQMYVVKDFVGTM